MQQRHVRMPQTHTNDVRSAGLYELLTSTAVAPMSTDSQSQRRTPVSSFAVCVRAEVQRALLLRVTGCFARALSWCCLLCKPPSKKEHFILLIYCKTSRWVHPVPFYSAGICGEPEGANQPRLEFVPQNKPASFLEVVPFLTFGCLATFAMRLPKHPAAKVQKKLELHNTYTIYVYAIVEAQPYQIADATS